MDPVTSDLVVLLVNVVTMLLIGAIVWYVRKYVISEVEKNSSLRRHLLGEEQLDASEGHLTYLDERFDHLEGEMHRDHQEVQESMIFLGSWIERIANVLERELGEEDLRPDDVPDAFRYRGGEGSASDD